MYATRSRENAGGTLDTAFNLTELGANSPGSVIVPRASMLTGIKIVVGPDWTADAAYAFTSALRLVGLGGQQSYPGPCMYTLGVGTGSSGSQAAVPINYKTRIPVTPGQAIDLQGFMHGEDVGELHMLVTLEFDGYPGVIRDMDYREETLAAANTPVVLGAKWGSAHAYIQPATRQIGEIHVNGAPKLIAGPLAAPTLFEIFGDAIPEVQQFAGPSFASQDDLLQTTSSGGPGPGSLPNTIYYIPPDKMPLKSGNFQAQAQMIEDDVGDVFAIIGIGYI